MGLRPDKKNSLSLKQTIKLNTSFVAIGQLVKNTFNKGLFVANYTFNWFENNSYI